MAARSVADGKKPLGWLYRERSDAEGDSGWRVFAGDESPEEMDDPDSHALYNASTIVAQAPGLEIVLDFEAPIAFERDPKTGEFVEIEYPEEPEE